MLLRQLILVSLRLCSSAPATLLRHVLVLVTIPRICSRVRFLKGRELNRRRQTCSPQVVRTQWHSHHLLRHPMCVMAVDTVDRDIFHTKF